MKKKYVSWLYKQLPELVENKIITVQTAQRIRKYYGEVRYIDLSRISDLLFGLLGAVLIGLGIILFFAYNWHSLTRVHKVILSFIPLLAGQVLTGWVILQKRDSLAWREPCSTFLALSMGFTLALISQAYHISGDLGLFLLIWVLLCLPVFYLLQAIFPALLYLAGITVWTFYQSNTGEQPVWFWMYLLLFLPFFGYAAKRYFLSIRYFILAWGLGICVILGTGISLANIYPHFWIVLYTALFAIMLLVEVFFTPRDVSIWARPFYCLATIGIFLLALLLTFKEPWQNIGWQLNNMQYALISWQIMPQSILSALFVLSALFFLFFSLNRVGVAELILASTPIWAGLAYILTIIIQNDFLASAIMNVFVFVSGVAFVYNGVEQGQLTTTNKGLFLISALILLRFFDSELNLVLRGIAFIIIGLGFIGLNVFLATKKRNKA